MPRVKEGVSPWACSLPTEAKEGVSEIIAKLGYTYNGRPSLGAFLRAIYAGEIIIYKKEVDTGNSMEL